MKPALPFAIGIALLAASALPAAAQSSDNTWSGFYIGGQIGGSEPSSDRGSRILFDTNLDGSFGDTVRTGTGADAFSPGFCDGAANARTPGAGCREDKGGAEAGLRAGFDWQSGNLVYGMVLEYTQNDARDSVSAFSTTPALYTMTRDLDSTLALRARLGLAFGENSDWLGYATAGAVRGRFENSFNTSNGANAFPQSGETDANGYQAGVGIERKILENFSVGLEYLYTRLEDDEFRVRAAPGTAPATNPFLLVNPAGTDFRRSDEDSELNSLRLTGTFRF